MLAVISDIHANRQALAAVMEEMLGLGADAIICLGDVVGYGAEPEWCVDGVRGCCDAVLCGNHEAGLVYGTQDFSTIAERAIKYHRHLLMPRAQEDGDGVKRHRWDFLKGLPHRYVDEQGRLYIHAAPRNPTNEYLREQDVKLGMEKKFRQNFDLVESVCFIGHTHRPGVITEDLQFIHPPEDESALRIEEGRKFIVNVGSVGQPRDGDPRACFVTVDGPEVRFRRVAYDVEGAAMRIEQSGMIHPDLADRLRAGN